MKPHSGNRKYFVDLNKNYTKQIENELYLIFYYVFYMANQGSFLRFFIAFSVAFFIGSCLGICRIVGCFCSN